MRVLLPTHQELAGGGIATIVRGLTRHLRDAMGPADELVLDGIPHTGGSRLRALLAHRGASGALARLLEEQWFLRGAARNVDLVHLCDLRPVLSSRTPFVITVHDLSYFDHPEWMPAAAARYKRLMLRASLAKGPAAIVCDSEHTRTRLLERFPRAEERACVIHPGVVSSRFAPDPPPPADPNGGYFVTVASIEPRKNHLGLLAGYRLARARGLRLRWKVVGSPGHFADHIVPELRATEGVDVLGHVDDRERDRLYRGALFAVTPSFAEGFGYPPLEAMALGVPVMCSRGSALDETAADAAMRVSPGEAEEWAEALLRLESDAQERERLRQLGSARVQEFTWESTASALVGCFRGALEL